MADTDRCVVCGKVVAPKAAAMRITKGAVNTRKVWREDSVWGMAHTSCFVAAVDSPTSVMKELRRQSREDARSQTA